MICVYDYPTLSPGFRWLISFHGDWLVSYYRYIWSNFDVVFWSTMVFLIFFLLKWYLFMICSRRWLLLGSILQQGMDLSVSRVSMIDRSVGFVSLIVAVYAMIWSLFGQIMAYEIRFLYDLIDMFFTVGANVMSQMFPS